jgi:hypothetical protein
VTGTLQKATIWDTSTWEKVNSRGEINSGCGQFFTPQNNRIAVVSLVGIMFTYTTADAKICGNPPEGTNFMYYFKKQQRALYVLGDGQIWISGFPQDVSRIDKTHTHPNPSAIFLGANQESGLYASVSGSSLLIRNAVSGGTAYSPIPGQDDYYYQVAFLPTQKMFALGSRYGSIHIWALP